MSANVNRRAFLGMGGAAAAASLVPTDAWGAAMDAAGSQLYPASTSVDRSAYLLDPVGWNTDILGGFLWSKQRAIAESVVHYRRTAVPSCHDVGKTYIAARIAAWWLDVHEPGTAFVVSTAPSFNQVRAVLWREINRAHAAGHLRGRVNQTEWHMRTAAGNEQIVGYGRKPSDLNPAAFQGVHDDFVLVIIDEASGVARPLWDAADTLLTNEAARLLVIGNPDDAATQFEAVCKPGSGYHVIHIDGFKTPNFTKEIVPDYLHRSLLSRVWQQEKLKAWGEDSALYRSKIRGIFPTTTTEGLFPSDWVRDAQERTLKARGSKELGVDVGGGGDKNTCCLRHGPVARIIRSDAEPNTMVSLGNIKADLKQTGATVAKVDSIGIGRGMVDHAKLERGIYRGRILGINIGERAVDSEEFANLRAELYWGLRDRLEDDDLDLGLGPKDEALVDQMVQIKYSRTPRGQIQIESKAEMKRRGLPSPDELDALVLAYAPTPRVAGGMAIGVEKQGGRTVI